MATQLTADDAKQSLTSHLATKGAEIYQKYGPHLGWAELQRLLADRAYVRYPVEIRFESAELLAGEFAHPVAKGEQPEDGFVLYVHPLYMLDLERVSLLALYQLVVVNYGAFASSEDAEVFGASALGMARDDYYAAICELADRLPTSPEPSGGEAMTSGDCGSGGCGCH